MKTEDLQAKGLSQEQIDFVMAEYGKDLNAVKAERDGYKSHSDPAKTILMNNLTSEMSKDQVYVKMLLNAVTLSTDLATQIILDLLDSTDVLPITSDEKVLQKLALRLHTDNLKK